MKNDERLERALAELKQTTGLNLVLEAEELANAQKACKRIEDICAAYREKYDRSYFFKKLLYYDTSEYEINKKAEKLHIKPSGRRMLLLLKTVNPYDEALLTILKHMFPMQTGVILIPLSDKKIMFIKEIRERNIAEGYLQNYAQHVMDNLNAEALTSAKIVCGPIIENLREMHSAYSEMEMAMKVGELFHCERNIYIHDQTDVGLLVCELPKKSCIRFLNRVFKKEIPKTIEPEIISTANCFFNNNFNISETARQLHMHRNTLIYRLEQIEKNTGLDLRKFEEAMTFKIALMVLNYINVEKEV